MKNTKDIKAIIDDFSKLDKLTEEQQKRLDVLNACGVANRRFPVAYVIKFIMTDISDGTLMPPIKLPEMYMVEDKE